MKNNPFCHAERSEASRFPHTGTNCVFQNDSVCHAERREASRFPHNETLRFAQGDSSKSAICDRAQYIIPHLSSLEIP